MDIQKKNTSSELQHHGIKGMKWGVRRYQNYDGSYTQKGLERYRKVEASYEESKAKAQRTKTAYKEGTATKQQYKDSKQAVKSSKRDLNSAYDRLKTDKLADQGKRLYQQGKTITNNTRVNQLSQVGIVVGSTVLNRVLNETMKNTTVANLTTTTIAVGASVVNGILAIKTSSENKKLRAYYSH